MIHGSIIQDCIFEFEAFENPEFLGKYYKTYKQNNEIYYTNELLAENNNVES